MALPRIIDERSTLSRLLFHIKQHGAECVRINKGTAGELHCSTAFGEREWLRQLNIMELVHTEATSHMGRHQRIFVKWTILGAGSRTHVYIMSVGDVDMSPVQPEQSSIPHLRVGSNRIFQRFTLH